MLSEPGVAMKMTTLEPAGTILGDLLSHGLTGGEEVLADIVETGVGGHVGVVGDHGDAGAHGLLCRPVERVLVDQRDSDAVGLDW